MVQLDHPCGPSSSLSAICLVFFPWEGEGPSSLDRCLLVEEAEECFCSPRRGRANSWEIKGSDRQSVFMRISEEEIPPSSPSLSAVHPLGTINVRLIKRRRGSGVSLLLVLQQEHKLIREQRHEETKTNKMQQERERGEKEGERERERACFKMDLFLWKLFSSQP